MLKRLMPALAAVTLVAGVAAAAPVNPISGPYQEVHGEMVTGIPASKPCSITLTKDFRFHNTAYGQDAPFTGTYTPTCKGPWSKVVMTMSATVKTGTQFDRIGDVLIGGVTMLHLTTAEGESGATSWSISRDITDYAPVLTRKQPAYFIIGNQTDGTYTGDFYGTLTLDFYSGKAPAGPDQVLGISPGVNKGLPTRSDDAPLTSSVTLPANATSLTAEVFASGHGAEEEDWWNAPFACTGGGVPYREVSVTVDGRLAGVAPVFPTIYTGGYGPDFWRPFPSPRAFNLRPYRLDLTPFVGGLTDGRKHTFSIATVGQTKACDGYWFLGGNLRVGTNHTSRGRTTGGVLTGAPSTLVPTGNEAATVASYDVKRHLEVSGVVKPAGQPAATVKVVHDVTSSAADAAIDLKADWTWTSSTSFGSTVLSSQTSTYQLIRTGPTWHLTDNQDTTELVGGKTRTTTYRDAMQTGGPVLGVTGVVGASQETWSFKTSEGVCATHTLVGAVQNVLVDQVSTTC